MTRSIKTTLFVFFLFLLINPKSGFAQVNQRLNSQQFRLGERIIRVAEPGQLADSINVWGDVVSAGRYLVPKGTTLPQLISYAYGPSTIRTGQTTLDWSEMRVEITVSDYKPGLGKEVITHFEYHMDEPLPKGMRTFVLHNNQVVTVQVKRKPSFVDYMRVIGPIISAVATTILVVQSF